MASLGELEVRQACLHAAHPLLAHVLYAESALASPGSVASILHAELTEYCAPDSQHGIPDDEADESTTNDDERLAAQLSGFATELLPNPRRKLVQHASLTQAIYPVSTESSRAGALAMFNYLRSLIKLLSVPPYTHTQWQDLPHTAKLHGVASYVGTDARVAAFETALEQPGDLPMGIYFVLSDSFFLTHPRCSFLTVISVTSITRDGRGWRWYHIIVVSLVGASHCS